MDQQSRGPSTIQSFRQATRKSCSTYTARLFLSPFAKTKKTLSNHILFSSPTPQQHKIKSDLPFNSMATFSTISTIVFLLLSILNVVPSLSLPTSPNKYIFDSDVAVLGGAHFSDNGSFVILTNSPESRSGLVTRKSPFKFLDSGSGKMASFSTEFAFSSTGKGNAMSLVMGPHDFASALMGRGQFGVLGESGYVGVDFGISVDSNVGNGGNANLVGVRVGNVSMNLVTSSGEKMKSWVDYDASSKILQIRLNKFGDKRPYTPMISYSIDLLKLWRDSDVYVGLGSLNGNSSVTCLYSWRVKLRKFPYSLHSLPADPYYKEDRTAHKRRFCPFAVLAGMIFATGCGALVAFMVLFAWAVFASCHTVFPAEGDVLPTDFRYEKINLVVENDVKVVKN